MSASQMETLGCRVQGSHESQPSASAYNSGSYWPHSFLRCQERNSASEAHARDNLGVTNCGIKLRIRETTVLLEKALISGARDCGKGPGGQAIMRPLGPGTLGKLLEGDPKLPKHNISREGSVSRNRTNTVASLHSGGPH